MVGSFLRGKLSFVGGIAYGVYQITSCRSYRIVTYRIMSCQSRPLLRVFCYFSFFASKAGMAKECVPFVLFLCLVRGSLFRTSPLLRSCRCCCCCCYCCYRCHRHCVFLPLPLLLVRMLISFVAVSVNLKGEKSD